ncbi:glycosyltransferase family 4 protein [Kushneria sp. AK178]
MRICFFLRNVSLPSGIERVTSVVANRLAEKGVDVSIVSLWGGLEPFYEKNENVKLYQLFPEQVTEKNKSLALGKRLGRFPAASCRLRRLLKEHPQDIVIDTDYLLGQVALPALAGLPTRHVHWEHFCFNLDLGRPHKLMGRRLIARQTDGIITLTERDAGYWQQGARPNGPIRAIPNPVPFDPPEQHYNPDSKTVLAVGRLNHQKGFDRLLEAWAQIRHQTGADHDEWQLVILGSGEEDNALKASIARLAIEQSVTMVPATSDVSSHYHRAAILAMTSRFEGFPMVLLEAQAHRLPIVAFDCDTGPAEIIEHDQSGYLVEQDNIADFARQLGKLMGEKDKRIEFSNHAAQSIQRFDIEPIANRWISYLQHVLDVRQ